MAEDSTNTLVLAGGCFWGMEELFRQQPGVRYTSVGYTGGTNRNPTYEFHPGHAEAIEISYNSTETALDTLLDYFFTIHNPTTHNQQGNDIGTSYRSAIFYNSVTQKKAAVAAIERNQRYWKDPIATQLELLLEFWPAEAYHQKYLQRNPGGYTCHFERPR